MLLADQLGIAKGALLLPDYDGEHLAPWALRGIDRTSEHRLRIPVSMIAPLCDTASIGVVEEADLLQWKQYFSFREASMLRRIAVIPFWTDTELSAVILVVDCPYLLVESLAIKLIISAIRDPAQALLCENHETRRRATYRHVLSNIDEVTSHIMVQKNVDRTARVRIVTASISALVDSICNAYEGVDRFRIGQDVLRIAGSMLDGTANVGLIGQCRIAIVLRNDCVMDLELAVHQLQVGLTAMFQETETQLDLDPHFVDIGYEFDKDSILSALQNG